MTRKEASGLFTLGLPPERYHLPHPRLGLRVILLVRRVILRAFELLREEGFNLAAAKEDQVTTALLNTIENDLRQTGEVRGFNKHTFESVRRQVQCENFDGSRLNKTPDVYFKLTDYESSRDAVLSVQDGLFVEAKPVDSEHPVGGRYCDDGLSRFVRGDYAWAMEEAMMLAYARDGRTIAKHLVPAMKEASRMAALKTKQLPTPLTVAGVAATPFAEAIHVSRHRREFPWPHGKGKATPVEVFHVWCSCG